MTTQIPQALAISKLIKNINKSCLVVWGGCHPTFFKEQTAKHELVDLVCYGEGEETIWDAKLFYHGDVAVSAKLTLAKVKNPQSSALS